MDQEKLNQLPDHVKRKFIHLPKKVVDIKKCRIGDLPYFPLEEKKLLDFEIKCNADIVEYQELQKKKVDEDKPAQYEEWIDKKREIIKKIIANKCVALKVYNIIVTYRRQNPQIVKNDHLRQITNAWQSHIKVARKICDDELKRLDLQEWYDQNINELENKML